MSTCKDKCRMGIGGTHIRCQMSRMDPETVFMAVMSLVVLAILAASTVAVELAHRTEPGTPVVVEREDGDGRTALVLDYEGEHYVIDIREDDLDERR